MRRTKFILLGGVVLFAGCAEGDGNTGGLTLSVPPSAAPPVTESGDPEVTNAPSPTPSQATDTVSDEETSVLAAYRAFHAAVEEANADPQQSQDYLAPVATGAQFEQTNGGIKADFLAGEVVVGSPVMDPTVASVSGGEAVVQDCQDTRDVVLQDVETEEPLVIGRFPDSVETTLTLVDGVWKVSATQYADDPGVFCE